jgi:hypothetical protein
MSTIGKGKNPVISANVLAQIIRQRFNTKIFFTDQQLTTFFQTILNTVFKNRVQTSQFAVKVFRDLINSISTGIDETPREMQKPTQTKLIEELNKLITSDGTTEMTSGLFGQIDRNLITYIKNNLKYAFKISLDERTNVGRDRLSANFLKSLDGLGNEIDNLKNQYELYKKSGSTEDFNDIYRPLNEIFKKTDFDIKTEYEFREGLARILEGDKTLLTSPSEQQLSEITEKAEEFFRNTQDPGSSPYTDNQRSFIVNGILRTVKFLQDNGITRTNLIAAISPVLSPEYKSNLLLMTRAFDSLNADQKEQLYNIFVNLSTLQIVGGAGGGAALFLASGKIAQLLKADSQNSDKQLLSDLSEIAENSVGTIKEPEKNPDDGIPSIEDGEDNDADSDEPPPLTPGSPNPQTPISSTPQTPTSSAPVFLPPSPMSIFKPTKPPSPLIPIQQVKPPTPLIPIQQVKPPGSLSTPITHASLNPISTIAPSTPSSPTGSLASSSGGFMSGIISRIGLGGASAPLPPPASSSSSSVPATSVGATSIGFIPPPPVPRPPVAPMFSFIPFQPRKQTQKQSKYEGNVKTNPKRKVYVQTAFLNTESRN